MNQRLQICFEVLKRDEANNVERMYGFSVPYMAPLAECEEACAAFLDIVRKQATKQEEQKAEEA